VKSAVGGGEYKGWMAQFDSGRVSRHIELNINKMTPKGEEEMVSTIAQWKDTNPISGTPPKREKVDLQDCSGKGDSGKKALQKSLGVRNRACGTGTKTAARGTERENHRKKGWSLVDRQDCKKRTVSTAFEQIKGVALHNRISGGRQPGSAQT